MRKLTFILAGAALASCTTAPTNSANNAYAQQQLAALLAGKVAGPPVDCLPQYQSNMSSTITPQAIAFTANPSRVYVNNIAGTGCGGLSDPTYTLVTTSHGTSGLCRGDAVKIIDRQAGTMMGSCLLGSFVPYTRP
jgi:hypothetical protein